MVSMTVIIVQDKKPTSALTMYISIYILLLVWKNANDKAHMAFTKMKKDHFVCFRLIEVYTKFWSKYNYD